MIEVYDDEIDEMLMNFGWKCANIMYETWLNETCPYYMDSPIHSPNDVNWAYLNDESELELFDLYEELCECNRGSFFDENDIREHLADAQLELMDSDFYYHMKNYIKRDYMHRISKNKFYVDYFKLGVDVLFNSNADIRQWSRDNIPVNNEIQGKYKYEVEILEFIDSIKNQIMEFYKDNDYETLRTLGHFSEKDYFLNLKANVDDIDAFYIALQEYKNSDILGYLFVKDIIEQIDYNDFKEDNVAKNDEYER